MEPIQKESLWKKALAQLEVKVDNPAHFKTWFIPTTLLEVNGKNIVIGVKNSYAADWLRRKYLIEIEEVVNHILKQKNKIDFIVSKTLANTPIPKITKEESQQSLLTIEDGESSDFREVLKQAELNPEFSIDNYVVGPSNRLFHAASLAIIESPGKVYNPLFVFGDTGLGKTHLAQSIGRRLLELSASKKVLYKPSENFLNEMVDSIKTGKQKKFRNKYRYLDLLIIDDIQMIYKWEQTQDELFNTFNALQNKSKQIILISDRPPEKIKGLEPRLLSRFQGGMVVQVEKPDFETRLAILQKKSREFGINLPEQIIEYLAKNVNSNVRQLEGTLKQISLFNQIHIDNLSIEEVATLIGKDQKSKREKIKPSVIIKIVAKEFQITSKDILSRSRKADIALARQIVMFFLRENLGYKLEEIAKTLNRKDHTTVIHAIDKVKSKIELDSGFSEQITNIQMSFE